MYAIAHAQQQQIMTNNKKDGQVYTQHDVLELADVLFDFIENQAFGFRLADVVSTYHRMNVLSYAQCLQCEHLRPRQDSSHGIGLDIEKATSFDDAMKRYITPEILTDGNKVNCDVCNEKTSTKKGYRFDSFPYILKVYFRRWTFNMATLSRVKIDKEIPFPLEFDANQYIGCDGYWQQSDYDSSSIPKETLSRSFLCFFFKCCAFVKPIIFLLFFFKKSESNNKEPQIYELYAMLIHTGGAMGGHYFAYIKDFDTGKWFQFNDSRVVEIPLDVLNDFFKQTPEDKQEQEQKDKDTSEQNTTDSNETNDKDTANNSPVNEKGDFALEEDIKKKLVGKMGGIDVSGALADALKKKEETRKRFENAKPCTVQATEPCVRENETKTESTSNRPSFINPMKAAYMLIYRLKDASKNMNHVSRDIIPEALVEEIQREDIVYLRQKEEYERVKDLLNLAIYYKDEIHEVFVDKRVTLGEAYQQVLDKLRDKVPELSSLKCMRLRKMKVMPRPVPMEPLDNDLFDRTLEHLQFADVEHLWLETRTSEEEPFPVYEPARMELRMVELDVEKMELKPELIVFVPEDGTVRDLRQACADMMGLIDPTHLRLVFQSQDTAALWINDNLKLKVDQRLRPGDTIHVERCDNYLTGDSVLLKRFNDMLNVVTIRYNKLLKEHEEVVFDQFLSFDIRQSLGELKTKLSEALSVPMDELVLRRNFNDHEFKDLTKSLLYYEMRSNSHIFVEKGKPLKSTEFLFQIFIEDEIYKTRKREYDQKKVLEEAKREVERVKKEKQSKGDKDNANETVENNLQQQNNEQKTQDVELPGAEPDLGDAFLFVGNVILDENWKMGHVKQVIFDAIPNVLRRERKRKKKKKKRRTIFCIYFMPHPDYMRIRDFTSSRLTKVYLDTKTLRGNCGRGKNNVHDFQQICVQKVATKEHLTKDHLLLLVGRWYPREMDFAVFEELSFLNSTPIKTDLRRMLSEYSGISFEDLQVIRPFPYQITKVKERAKLCVADWEMLDIRNDSTLASKRPWKCKSGDYIVFKDRNEKELYTREDFDMGLVSLAPFIREEVPLIFYTPEQQIEREVDLF
ncbi:hypothetical protein RFI_16943 [Reticulomyxa filosa]|uniref:USP domain-containing protein n=1 Tax=Reticulomyxa filosa TaxID=46433 RepID=X6N305_RETFI|nr:hypothetical protein RFI_16943 [Reticulomyxa filosa]|eukprot:ETO20273.1 hypothetical protein RFI_16943 [Reticulomyxa filosa]